MKRVIKRESNHRLLANCISSRVFFFRNSGSAIRRKVLSPKNYSTEENVLVTGNKTAALIACL